MRIDIPVITRCGLPVKIEDDGASIVDKVGHCHWTYKGKEVTGKGIYIAACARSGTKYITEVLRKTGYEIGHEKTDTDGSVGYHLAIIRPDNCFHQVRHPLDQIASMLDHQNWGFMNQVIELEGHGLKGCMQYWLKWNELLESFCIWRYRIERLKDVWWEFLNRIEHDEYVCLPDVPTDTNKRKKIKTVLNWDRLSKCDSKLARLIYDKHLEYGYSPERDREERKESQDSSE